MALTRGGAAPQCMLDCGLVSTGRNNLYVQVLRAYVVRHAKGKPER